MKKKGFTLIELIMVIVIIGILAAIAIPRFMDLEEEAEIATCQASGAGLRAAIISYYASAMFSDANTVWPAALDEPTMVPNYLQSWPSSPVAGQDWGDAAYYSPSAGVLDIDAACTPP